jgi:mannonate dehydratase
VKPHYIASVIKAIDDGRGPGENGGVLETGEREGYIFPPQTREVFPGCPEIREGALWANDRPGLGTEIDEKLAAKFPFPEGRTFDHGWGETRRRDGTVIRP